METIDSLTMNWRSGMLALMMVCTAAVLTYLYLTELERKSAFWFFGFVIAGMISAIPMVIGFAGAYDKWPGLTFLPTQMMPFFGPLIFIHARILMVGELPKNWVLLLAPGAIYWLYQVWAFLFLGDYKAKWAYNDAVHYPYIFPAVTIVAIGLAAWALIAIWQMRRGYLEWLEQNRSDDDDFHPTWLTRLIVLGVPLFLIWMFDSFADRFLGFSYFEQFWGNFLSLLLLFLISLEALVRIQRPFPKMLDISDAPSSASDPTKPGRDWESKGHEIRMAVEKNKWHLESGISLQELARRVGTNQAYLSRALNQGLNQSFSEFINELRVEHAKQLIGDTEQSLIEIALASGFGSKASFNRAFSKFVGQTPSAYAAQSKTDAKL